VAAFREYVELGPDLELLEGLEVDEHVLFVDGIVLGLEQEGGWGVGGGIDAARELGEGGRLGEVGGVDADDEVRPGADGGVGCRLVKALEVGVIAEDDYEMTAGGEAEDADAVGVEVPVGGVGADDADRLLGVFEVASVFGKAFFDGNAY
jgi:hypothetical protein